MAPDDTRTSNRPVLWHRWNHRGRNRAGNRAQGPRADQLNAAARFSRRAALVAAGAAGMSVLTDYPDWAPHVALAQQVANTGVPLLNLPSVVYQSTGNVIAGNGNFTTAAFTVNQPGYEVYVTCQFATGTASPFVEVQLFWLDPGGAYNVATDSWVVPGATAAAGFVVRGRGPSKGSSVVVSVNNLDSANSATVGIHLLQHSRPVNNDDWRWANFSDKGLTVPGFTLPTLPNDESVVGMGNDTIAGSSSISRLVGMYNGRIKVGLNLATGTLASITFNLQALPSAHYQANNPIIGGAAPGLVFEVAGVRGPMLLRIINTVTTSITVAWSMVACP